MKTLALAVAVLAGLAACGGPEATTSKQVGAAPVDIEPIDPTAPTPPPVECPYKGFRIAVDASFDPQCAGGVKITYDSNPWQWLCLWACNAERPTESILGWASNWPDSGVRIDALGVIPYCEFDPLQACAE
jgi:hypothetical protein